MLQRIIEFFHKWYVRHRGLFSSKYTAMALTSVSGDVFLPFVLGPNVPNRRCIQVVHVIRFLGKVSYVVCLEVDLLIFASQWFHSEN